MTVGTVLGDRYKLRERLGEGGFGAIWHARDRILGPDHPDTLRGRNNLGITREQMSR